MKNYKIKNKNISHTRKQKMRKYFSLFTFGFSLFVTAQTTPSFSENYIYTKTYLSQDGTKNSETVQYFDGLGRAKQLLSVKATPTGKDLVVPIVYDDLGRQTRSILPVPMPTANGGIQPVSEATANAYYGVSNAYSEQKQEASPLARVQEIAHPGTEWAMSSGHTTKIQYLTNTEGDQVKKYNTTVSWSNATLTTSISSISFYPPNQLSKSKVTDEDGNITTDFKNSEGKTILLRKESPTEKLDTYYIYNDYGQLVYIISPKANAEIAANGNIVTQQVLNELCYQYKYDHKFRQVEKKLPGKEEEYFVYDLQNRLVASQDANQRSEGKWLFTRYDKYGRIAYTGVFSGGTRLQEQANANAKGLNNEARSTTAFIADNQEVFYTNTAYPSAAAFTLYNINYYDTYPGNTQPPGIILNQATIANTTHVTVHNISSIRNLKTMPTASMVRNIENDGWTKSYIWYDTKGRTIGTQSFNHLGGNTRTETELDFAGVSQKVNTYHSRNGGNEVAVKERFVYNSQNMLLGHYHQVDDHQEELLAENAYNDLGQLINKKVGNLQSIDYQYNIRGWLTKINDPVNLNGKLFGYELRYQNPDNTQLATGRYNGNISEVSWKIMDNDILKRYSYSYDPFNRLTTAQFSNPAFSIPENHWNDETVNYDQNGNILHLTRNARNLMNDKAEMIDHLVYEYSGNRLLAIYDESQNPTGYEGGGNSLEYDDNGNMTSMPDKSIDEIGYNHLNLPNSMRIEENTKKMFYTYRADGTKLRKIYHYIKEDSSVFTTITEYLDGFHYLTTLGSWTLELNPLDYAYEQESFIREAVEEEPFPTLKFFPTAEGFYDYENNEYIYQYRDHLGNARVSYKSVNGEAEITDKNNYYPFGMNIPREEKAIFGTASLYNYKYNGKELQETGMYAMDWRNYMPDIGRFTGMDVLSESYASHTPYHFGMNNPSNYSDPTGMYTIDSQGNISTSDQGEISALFDYFSGGGSVGKLNNFISGNSSFHLDLDEVVVKGKSGGFGAGTYNGAVMESAINQLRDNWNFQQNWSSYYSQVNGNPVEDIHFMLDAAGNIPVVGELFDGFNSLLYVGRGDYVNAAASLSAMIPFVGSGLKYGIKGAGKKITTAVTEYWPKNGGALGKWEREFLMPGTEIDRFGSGFGKYFSPINTPMNMRALPEGNTGAYNAFKVVKPFEVQSSTIAPAFGKIGLGKQYLSPVNMNTLLKRGIIVPIK